MSRHYVVVEDGVLVSFTCEDEHGPCHTYPVCDCEEWSVDMHDTEYGKGHEYAYHEDCWMKGWFDNPESTSYNGEDEGWDWLEGGLPPHLTRSGYIETDWEDCVVWNFIEEES